MIHVIATLTIKPGSADAVIAAARPCIAETRKEAGCISYDLHASQTVPDRLVFVERWETREALDGHFAAPHMKVWRAAGAPYIVSREIEIVHSEKVERL